MDQLMLQPMLAMIVLTMIVWVVLYARRLPAMRKAGLLPQEYTTPDRGTELLPEAVSYPSNNFKNLFEMPVLFYALCLYFHVTQSIDSSVVIAAWSFVALRAVPSAIHCTVNIVVARFAAYVLATFALLYMLVTALIRAGWFQAT